MDPHPPSDEPATEPGGPAGPPGAAPESAASPDEPVLVRVGGFAAVPLSPELATELRAVFDTTPRGRRVCIALSVALAATVIDQLTKWWVASAIPPGAKSVPVVPGVLWLAHVYNKGVAWGIMSNRPLMVTWIAIGTSVLVLGTAVIGRFGWKPYIVGLGLVIGGAVGNLIDRAVRPAGVLDFIDLGWWPQFNAADAAVVCGAILIAWCVFRASLVEHAFLRKHLLIETAEIADDPERGEA